MEINHAIFGRRAVRSYGPRDVPPALVQQLLEYAVQAPSALNLQPWAFAVFHGASVLHPISERAKAHLVETHPPFREIPSRSQLYEDPAYDLFHGAPVLVVIYAKQGRLQPREDCCLAAQNLMLAAHSFGLGTCPIGFAQPWFDLATTKSELGVPSSHSAVFPVVLGYPAGEVPPVPRNAPDILVWQWSEATSPAPA
jgi:nitroreductase